MRVLILVLLALQACGQELRPGPVHYLGRRVAKTMSYHGANWLVRPEREREERASELFEVLGVKEGWTVADLGCGNGFHAIPLAKRVGKTGKILAVDIQPQMLRLLEARARKAGVEDRIQPILATAVDPKLPSGSTDLLIMVDVYHEISHPGEVLAHIRRALKPKGRAVWVEFRTEDTAVPIKPEHKMSKAQVVKEAVANGFKLVRSYDDLPWQHVLFFERDEDWKPAPRASSKVIPEAPSPLSRKGAVALDVDAKSGHFTLRHDDGRSLILRIDALERGRRVPVTWKRLMAAPWSIHGTSAMAKDVSLVVDLTEDGGLDVIARAAGFDEEARGPLDVWVAIEGSAVAGLPLHRLSAGRLRPGEALPWRIDPAPKTEDPPLPIPVDLAPFPMFGLGSQGRGAALFTERLPYGLAFSIAHRKSGVHLIGRCRRPEPEAPVAFRFHVALPKSFDRPALEAGYEAWAHEGLD